MKKFESSMIKILVSIFFAYLCVYLILLLVNSWFKDHTFTITLSGFDLLQALLLSLIFSSFWHVSFRKNLHKLTFSMRNLNFINVVLSLSTLQWIIPQLFFQINRSTPMAGSVLLLAPFICLGGGLMGVSSSSENNSFYELWKCYWCEVRKND